jgi:hypothetical protein
MALLLPLQEHIDLHSFEDNPSTSAGPDSQLGRPLGVSYSIYFPYNMAGPNKTSVDLVEWHLA